jgi:hypothetical protein
MILIAKIFLVESRIKYLVGEVYDKWKDKWCRI